MYSSDEDEVPVVYLTDEVSEIGMPPPPGAMPKQRLQPKLRKSRRRRPEDERMTGSHHHQSSQHRYSNSYGKHRKRSSRMDPIAPQGGSPGAIPTPPITSAYAADAAMKRSHSSSHPSHLLHQQQHRTPSHHHGSRQHIPSQPHSQFNHVRPSSSSSKLDTVHKIGTPKPQDVPVAFRLGGSLFEKAKSIFQQPQPSSDHHAATPSPPKTQQHSAPPAWQSYNPQPQSQLYQSHRISPTSTSPPGMFDNTNFMDGPTPAPGVGFTDPPPAAMMHDFRDPFKGGDDEVAKKEEQQVADDLSKVKLDTKEDLDPPKSMFATLKEIHPAIYFSTILAGLLIVRQRDDIEGYLHDGIGMLFSTINALTILITVVGAAIFCINFIMKRTIRAGSGEEHRAHRGEELPFQQQMGPMPEDYPHHRKTLDDLMDNQHFNDDHRNFNSYSNLPAGFAPPLMDEFYNEFGEFNNGPMSPQYYQQQPPPGKRDNRSFSIPAVLQPQAVRPSLAQQYSYGSVPKRSPTSAPMFDPAQNMMKGNNNNNNGSYFPNMDALKMMGLGLDTPKPSPPQPHSATYHKSPTPIMAGNQHHTAWSPMAMPSVPIGMGHGTLNPMPRFEQVEEGQGDEDDDDEYVGSLVSQPSIEVMRDEQQQFVNPKKVVFRRREQTPVIKDDSDDEDVKAPKKEHRVSYADDFSCKPWGPPPKRYNGVNV